MEKGIEVMVLEHENEIWINFESFNFYKKMNILKD